MEISEQLDILDAEGRRLAAAAAAAGPDATVPSCPGWLVRDLVRHQGGVHRWATAFAAGRTEPWNVSLDEIAGAWPADPDLIGWFTEGHARLVGTLRSASPDLACWTFLAAPSPLAMWSRRQAHETAVHRADAELAASGQVTGYGAAFAADGIDELLTCFITRRSSRLRSERERSILVRCTDTPGEWLVRIRRDQVVTAGGTGQAGSKPPERSAGGHDCLVAGTAADLYLALWNRRTADDLAVDGDRGVLSLFLDRVRVRWS